MEQIQIQNALEHYLRTSAGNEAGGVFASELARSVAGSISYDRSLDGLESLTIRKAVENSGPDYEHAKIMANLRSFHQRYKTFRKERKTQEDKSKANDNSNWGMLIQCIATYAKNGNILTENESRISFLSQWIQERDDILREEDIRRCELSALRSTAGMTDTQQKEREYKKRKDYNIVTLAVIRINGEEESSPLSLQIREKKKQYREYVKEKYGCAPEWTND